MFEAKGFTRNIRPYVEAELAHAHKMQNQNNQKCAFTHLENAHVLGQASTRLHVKVHVQMLLWAVKQGNIVIMDALEMDATIRLINGLEKLTDAVEQL